MQKPHVNATGIFIEATELIGFRIIRKSCLSCSSRYTIHAEYVRVDSKPFFSISDHSYSNTCLIWNQKLYLSGTKGTF